MRDRPGYFFSPGRFCPAILRARDLRCIALVVTTSLLISCGGGGGGNSISSADTAAATAAAANSAADIAATAAAAATVAAANAAAAAAAAAAANSASANAAAAAASAAATAAANTAAAAEAAAAAAAASAAAAATAAAPAPTQTASTLVLSLPKQGLLPSELAVIVAQGDANSEAIASYYVNARGIPAANIIRVSVPTGSDSISSTAFTTLKAAIDAQLPSTVQATLLTWSAPSRVTGSCNMSITSAMAFGFNASYCVSSGCASTTASSYYDSESALPFGTYSFRPSMMLGANTLIGTTAITSANALAAAQALIDRGVSADATYPTGDGYVLRTSDANRSVRYADYIGPPALTTLWSGNTGLNITYLDNSLGAGTDTITGKSNVLFYFTGLANVSGIASNTFRPGAPADHLTSYGGFLPSGNGQMPITAWLAGGATASYGTVEEPCNYTEKFSKASVLIDHYYRGDTLIEAYWKSVQWPGEGLFVGEPLSQPFRNAPNFAIVNGAYAISTRSLRPGGHYSLQYRIAPSTIWITLKTFVGMRVQASTLSAPLPPSNATHIQWVGPCPSNASMQCTLSASS